MKTPIINQIDLFYDIIKQKSTYNALFGKSSPKDGRVLRWGMLISFFSLIPPFIILTKFQTDMLQFLFATLCLLAISIFIRDRKSTRLNSSHVKISYAVFCLKKKKKF